ncbi:helix-turn-helix domain-containing protein, partial [Desulfovibrio sp. OttesenSCG-928-C14]|nr:helix-turn-helix domain-containing protein [Desulfovibrio sp. OttesenSCG-928-C14]
TIADQDIDLEKAIADALEKILAPVAEVICEMERIRRKEYLTEKEAALLFSLSAATLKTQRSRGDGPCYIKMGSRILYNKGDLLQYIANHRAP